MTLRTAALVLVALGVAQGRPSFEVASIRPNKSGSRQVRLDLQPGGRFVATNVSLQMLISVAYGESGPLPQNRLVINAQWMGGGDYLTSDHYDIEAKADGDLTQSQLPYALQALLADRFKLVVHHDTRELPVYALMTARTDQRLGPRLRRSDVDCSNPRAPEVRAPDGTSTCGFRRFPGSAKGRVTMSDLTRLFNGATDDHRPVENRTGLAGTFEFELEWTPSIPLPADVPPGPPVDPNGASLFTAVKEQLGLRLEPQKQRIDILVVDRAEHPTED